MSQGWVTKKLKDVCVLQRGFDLPKKDRRSGNFPLISSSGAIDFHAEAKVTGPGVVTGRSGSIGQVFFIEEDFWPLNTSLYIKEFHGNYPRFIYYLLKSFDLSRYTSGAGVPTLNRNHVHDEDVLIPLDIEEQKRIVAILDQAFADIEKARALTEQNLKNTRELFESYLQQMFSQRGEGWNKYRMSDICEITSKLVDPREDQYLELPHIGAGNMVSGTGELIEIKTAREEGLISGKFVFDDSMVLYSKIRPYLMKVCRPSFAGLCSADVYPLAPVNGRLDKNYLYYLLLTKEFTDYAVLGSGRAGMPKVNRNHLFNFSTYLPHIDKQREYVEKINEISDQARSLERLYIEKLHKLNELKSSLLQKAFSGELSKDNQEAAA